MRRDVYMLVATLAVLAVPGCNILNDYGNWVCSNDPAACAAGRQTQSCPVLFNVTGTVTVWECNIPPQACNGAQGLPGEGAGGGSVVAAGCGCITCQTSAQAALAQAQQILAMQSLSVDPSGPPLQCRGPIATLSDAYDTGSLFTVNECTQLTPATCRPCDDGAGGILQSVGQPCGTWPVSVFPMGSNCCSGLACIDPSTGQPLLPNTGDSQGFCQGTLATCPPAQPSWQGLTTTMLRQIAITNEINGCDTQTGITQNRTIGLAFERWVLTTMGQAKRWTLPILSQARQNKNNGLPASVIPEYVGPLSQWWIIPGGTTDYPQSTFFEVKAVNGTLTPSTNQSQILGLLNVAQISPAGMSAQTYPSPALIFTTTSNTTISAAVGTQATAWNVGLWQQIVQYDANGGTNPNLRITVPPAPLNPALYAQPVAIKDGFDPWPHSPLTAPTAPLSNFQVAGDPDPDSATVVE